MKSIVYIYILLFFIQQHNLLSAQCQPLSHYGDFISTPLRHWSTQVPIIDLDYQVIHSGDHLGNAVSFTPHIPGTIGDYTFNWSHNPSNTSSIDTTPQQGPFGPYHSVTITHNPTGCYYIETTDSYEHPSIEVYLDTFYNDNIFSGSIQAGWSSSEFTILDKQGNILRTIYGTPGFQIAYAENINLDSFYLVATTRNQDDFFTSIVINHLLEDGVRSPLCQQNDGAIYHSGPIISSAQNFNEIRLPSPSYSSPDVIFISNPNKIGPSQRSYLWNTGATTREISGLSSGFYQVTVTSPTGTELFNYQLRDTCVRTISGKIYLVPQGSTCATSPNTSHLSRAATVTVRDANNVMVANQYVYNGTYSFDLPPGVYNVSCAPQSSTIGTVICPANNTHTVTIASNSPSWVGQNKDFKITAPADISVDFIYNIPAPNNNMRPGFGYTGGIKVCNNTAGAFPSTTVTYTYDALMGVPTGFSAQNQLTVLQNDVANNQVVFTVPAFTNPVCYNAFINFTIPATTPLGTQMQLSVQTPVVDSNLTNNMKSASQTVVGSYDPNDKRMMGHYAGTDTEGDILPTDNVLDYVVRFQNTGTFPAYRVVIRDTLTNSISAESIRNIQMSHNGRVYIENGNVMVTEFINIQLPDSASNPAGSQGYIAFSINRDSSLALGSEIHNRVGIYFDFNEPIITNTAITRIALPCASTTATINTSHCGSITINGILYDISGTYTQQLNNTNGCDSTLTLNLTIDSMPTISNITAANSVGIVAVSGATYQWLDCSNNNPIVGETTNILAPNASGSYAVEVTAGTCTTLSDCFDFTVLSSNQVLADKNQYQLYPNPTTGSFVLTQSNETDLHITILDVLGRQLAEQQLAAAKDYLLELPYPAGTYFIVVRNSNGAAQLLKLLKQ
jgi:hypothetical protein